MALRLHREYRIKFYLNASHYILNHGIKGQAHPHTWEFVLRIRIARTDFVEFRQFERGINEFLAKYQNALLNDMEPFTEITPILENIVDGFAEKFYTIIREAGGTLIEIEAGESPTHSYILQIDWHEEDGKDAIMSSVADAVLDRMLKKDGQQ